MKVSKQALLALAAGSSMLVFAVPATGQTRGQASQPRRPTVAPRYNLSRPEQVALQPLIQANTAAGNARQAGQTPNWAAVQALLPAAQAAARSNDAKYLVARVQLDVAVGTNNLAAQEEAVTALVTNPTTTPEELTTYRAAQAAFLNQHAQTAFEARDFATAERIFQQLLQANPTDQRLINNLAIVRQRMGNNSGARDIVLQSIRTAEGAGRPAAENDYRRAFALAYEARDRAQAMELAGKLAQNYPTAANWSNAISAYRQLANPSPALVLDTLRFGRVAGALTSPNDYLGYAQILDQGALSGELKSVIDAGVAQGQLRAADPAVARLLATANRRIVEDRASLPNEIARARSGNNANITRALGDALYGYGRYAEAADLYRAALTKPGADTNLLNLRLGTALAQAGRRAEAEAALRAVGGDGTDLARLWLAWLARTGG